MDFAIALAIGFLFGVLVGFGTGALMTARNYEPYWRDEEEQ